MGARERSGAPVLRRGMVGILAFNALMVAWQRLHPASHALFLLVDNAAQFAGPLLALFLCIGRPWPWRPLPGVAPVARWVPALLGLGILGFALGQAIWTYYESVLHQPPFPSWADAGYLAAYPFLTLGILLLPTRPLHGADRARVLMDGLMIMVAVVTLSWYFILGPTLLQGGASTVAKVVGAAYPLWDLALIFCLILLGARAGDGAMRRVVRLLALGLGVIVATDCAFDYGQLQGTYATGGLVDVGWPLGYMLVGLAARALRLALAAPAPHRVTAVSDISTHLRPPPRERAWRWRSTLPYLPYTAAPAVIALVGYAWLVAPAADRRLALGASFGEVTLIGLVLARQVAAIRENARLYRQIEAHNRTLQALVTTDPLTGLGNHRAYHEEMPRALAHAARHGEALTLALLDLDDFKLINDQHGHTQGDRVLTSLGALLRERRTEDRAFRLGGDEFALLLPATTEEGAVAALNRLRQEAGQRLHGATVSVGLAALVPGAHTGETGETEDPAILREQADAALYEAKRRGRNAVVAFGEIREDAAIISGAKILAVRRLLAEREMTVAFQPIWDLERRAVLAYEALTRPAMAYALTGPQEAFDVAERIGRAHELDALCRAAILARAHELPPDALLFLNLSPASLDHALLAGDTLVAATLAAGLTPARVVLEITERSLARPGVVIREATRLRGLGFRIALDDVGAGNAGLEMLRLLPVDYLKIDRAVVAGAVTDTTTRSVLATILAFAREAGTFVIAEGIETEAMLDFVDRAGREPAGRTVRAVQGYLLGRPSATIPATGAIPQARSA